MSRETTLSPFAHSGSPARTRFGRGAIETVPAEVECLGCCRAVVLSTPHQHDEATDLLDSTEKDLQSFACAQSGNSFTVKFLAISHGGTALPAAMSSPEH
ncbi:hypothetical protein [Rhodococcus sp. APC 3903]|uniref:hypothetical protein n=1 Tax=Rhodococcus sp. APC 3903 TaxID=3035193 RepID=UPI0025B5047F|nr:hypothetical protein [Rhodococcus sp. APC 3903]MDN3460861.1 hypothetical protein [Rhodococcus sp. APC 3903]